MSDAVTGSPGRGRAPRLRPTPGQTVGPFFGFALPYDRGHELVDPGTPGAVRLHGRVLDGAGRPVPDALLEIWHADPSGAVVRRSGSILRDGTFTGWGRAVTDREGGYWFRTLEPGPTASSDGRRRPAMIAVAVFARGLTDRLFTRIYLPDDGSTGGEAALAADPLLASLEPERRATLLAAREPDGSLRFDVRLQGEGETVFLDLGQGTAGHAPPEATPDAAHGVVRGLAAGPPSDPLDLPDPSGRVLSGVPSPEGRPGA
ncbi:protocatechuate 3,4-dioxygenase subunit alpha [Isoptericola sp. NPDC060257]|uniref:protocatechuate 3,4-dioxygenase subunit alpha n=1 Tax=Isoptericola sp. NPDC060257 TaxID=3347087 RepID=UPI00364DE830